MIYFWYTIFALGMIFSAFHAEVHGELPDVRKRTWCNDILKKIIIIRLDFYCYLFSFSPLPASNVQYKVKRSPIRYTGYHEIFHTACSGIWEYFSDLLADVTCILTIIFISSTTLRRKTSFVISSFLSMILPGFHNHVFVID